MSTLSKVSSRTFGGKTFRCSEWVAGHLEYTVARLKIEHPKARLRIIQATFSDGPYSAGTHDFDAVLDVEIIGLAFDQAQTFLRKCGWAAWWRHTGTWAPRSNWHIHMASIPPKLSGRPTAAQVSTAYGALGVRVGGFVPAQVADYFNHALGLKGQHGSGSDKSWFPADIAATIYVPPEEALAALLAELRAVCKKHGVSRVYGARVLLKSAAKDSVGARLARINAGRTPLYGLDDPKK